VRAARHALYSHTEVSVASTYPPSQPSTRVHVPPGFHFIDVRHFFISD
jgi:hypothetical protein